MADDRDKVLVTLGQIVATQLQHTDALARIEATQLQHTRGLDELTESVGTISRRVFPYPERGVWRRLRLGRPQRGQARA